MALSNIFNEPRREITETVVGVAAFGLLGWADYAFAVRFEKMCGYVTRHDGSVDANMPWFANMLLGVPILIAFILFVLLLHGVGDVLCDVLEGCGAQMRPRNRPGQ